MSGRPPKTDLERLQAKLWFTAVAVQSGMNASQLERFFLKRLDPVDGDTKELSHSWLKYASGKRLPRDSKNGLGGVVSVVDSAFPGTAQWMRSSLWALLRFPELQNREIMKLVIRNAHSTLWQLFVNDDTRSTRSMDFTMRPGGWQRLIRSKSFEAFGLMLGYCRGKVRQGDRIAPAIVKDCRRWLHDAYNRFPTMREHRDELIRVLHAFAPELGDLAYLGRIAPDYDWFSGSPLSQLFDSEFLDE